MEAKITGERAGRYGELVADGFVDGPASEVDAASSYTFEMCIEGRWYRWTGARPVISFGRAYFELRGGTPIPTPTDL
jgi:hypothetical protein